VTEAQLHDTKERIMRAARVLFATKGYDGASVRDIAKLAGVNIAALNYHFQGKLNLFHQVIDLVFHETSVQIREHREQHPAEKVEELAVWIFGHFLDNGDILRAMFKMMLSEEGWGEEADCGGDEEPYGPPGGRALASAIVQELQREIPEADMYWAVKMVFSNVVHLALMYTNHFCELPPEQTPFHDRVTLEADIRRLVRVVLSDL
jgi:AcrR family transcriptional regulator